MFDKELSVPNRQKKEGRNGFFKTNTHLKSLISATGASFFWRCCLIITLLAVFPLSYLLPKELGWEDGLVEWMQVVVLAIGLILVYYFATQVNEKVMGHFWRWTAPLWLIMIGREIDWGATLYPPVRMGAFGPKYMALSELWYGQAVYPLLALLLIFWVVAIVMYKLYKVPLQLLREHTLPLFEIIFTGFIVVFFNCADQRVISIDGHAQMFEELLELVVYISFVVLAIATQRKILQKRD